MIGYAVINENGSYDIRNGYLIVFKQLDYCYIHYNNIKGNLRIVEAEINEVLEEHKYYYDVEEFRPVKIFSEDEIYEYFRNNQNKVDWYWISSRQKLSEDFIRVFKDKVDWYEIKYNQKLSAKFQKEFKDILSEY